VIGEHEFLAMRWYWTSFAYRNEAVAEQAYLQLAKVGKRHRGMLDLGFYRHGSPQSGMIVVTALGLKKHGVVTADKVLATQIFAGFEDEPYERTLEALIARRVRVVAEMDKQNYETGSYEYRREHGKTLKPDGTFE
jgi:hypothetical protein